MVRMEYRVLGPVEVRHSGRTVDLGGGKQRALLAVLLMHAGQVVSVDRLLDVLWDGRPPSTAVTQLQGLVSRLRRTLAVDDGDPTRLLTRPPGYVLEVAPGEVDLHDFEQLVDAAHQQMATGEMGAAADRLRAALSLWRGPPLGGVDIAELVEVEVPRLQEHRLSALEDRIEADLAVGRHAELIAEVRALVAAHPFRERLRGQLMIALYRAGRRAEALAAYRQGGAVLAEELGLDPGAELRRLEQMILTADSSLDLAVAPEAAEGAPTSVIGPAQLPPDITDFAGREKQVAQVCDLLAGKPAQRPPAVVVAIAGQAGVGKTTLAVHVAHRIRDRFPDGQLYVNLRGNECRRLDPGDVLARFLRALGVDGAAIPETTEERSHLFRSRLDGLRVLLVLDNAASEAQVRPLLPAGRSCAVLVTSRSRPAGLEGIRLVDLDVFDAEQAVALMSRLAGRDRVTAEAQAAEQILRLCGYLPLAVRVAGARLAIRPHWSLRRLADVLADEHRRLDELRVGDLDVRASLALSYAGLDDQARRGLRLLGMLDVPDFTSWAAAALLDTSQQRAEVLVDALADAQLLDVVGEDATGQFRYRFHDLARVYARERAEAEDTVAQRRAALARLLGAWLTLMDQAATRMPSTFRRHKHGTAARSPLDAGLVDTLLADPAAWFDTEQGCLTVIIERAAALGFDEAASDLCATLVSGRFVLSSRFDGWRRAHEAGLAATRRAGNRRGEALVLWGLARLNYSQGRFDAADEYYRQALVAFGEAGDSHGEAVTRCGLATVRGWRGRFAEAKGDLEQALFTFERTGDCHAMACVSDR